MSIKKKVGLHGIANYSGCNLEDFCLHSESATLQVNNWIEILTSIGVSTLGHHVHYFGSNSLSLSLNLSESHLNFHTWPEHSYVALDFFCCKSSERLKEEMAQVLNKGVELFKAKELEISWIERRFSVI